MDLETVRSVVEVLGAFVMLVRQIRSLQWEERNRR